MSTTVRRTAPAIIDRLLSRPQRFNFFQAVSLLLLHLKEHGVALDKALVGHLRFENSVSLGFPASDIETLRVERDTAQEGVGEAGDASAPDTRAQLRRIALTPTFMGYLGLHGALPNHYTQAVADLQHASKDDSVRAFLDIFQTRIVALFYEAWRKYRVEHTIGGAGDEFLPLLLALTGVRARVGDAAGDGAVDMALFGHYAGLLRQRPVSGAILARVLTDYFGVPVAARETLGYWDDLAPAERWRQGAPHMVLGERTVLGTRMWRPDLRIGLVIGPLTRAQFDGLGPKTARAKALKQLLAVFGSSTLSYEVALMLQPQAVTTLAFPAAGTRGQRIGYGTVLATRPCNAARVGMRYIVRPRAALPARRA